MTRSCCSMKGGNGTNRTGGSTILKQFCEGICFIFQGLGVSNRTKLGNSEFALRAFPGRFRIYFGFLLPEVLNGTRGTSNRLQCEHVVNLECCLRSSHTGALQTGTLRNFWKVPRTPPLRKRKGGKRLDPSDKTGDAAIL